jgi:5-methylcytosine-specific restriction endonuclease McrA
MSGCSLRFASSTRLRDGLRQAFRKVPERSRYFSDPVKGEVFERDGGQCVKCGSTRDLQYDQ